MILACGVRLELPGLLASEWLAALLESELVMNPFADAVYVNGGGDTVMLWSRRTLRIWSRRAATQRGRR